MHEALKAMTKLRVKLVPATNTDGAGDVTYASTGTFVYAFYEPSMEVIRDVTGRDLVVTDLLFFDETITIQDGMKVILPDGNTRLIKIFQKFYDENGALDHWEVYLK